MAAGGSSRLGQPKQLLPFHGSTLLEHTISLAKSLNDNCAVVLGSNFNLIKGKIEQYKIDTFDYKKWKEGIGGSIAFGLNELLLRYSGISDVLILLCDQPFIDKKLIRSMIDVHSKSNQNITACHYDHESFGVPAIFNRSYFPNLIALNGDKGAKKVIRENSKDTLFVEFPQGSIDIDQETDLRFLE